jgi:hypothetical protein
MAISKKKKAPAKKTNTPRKTPSKKKPQSILDEINSVQSPDLIIEPVSEEFNSVSFPEIFNFIRKSYNSQRRSKKAPDRTEESYASEKKSRPPTIEELDTQVRNLMSDLMLAIIQTGDQNRFETLINEYRDFLNDMNLLFKNR